MYGLDARTITEGVFWSALRCVNIIGELRETLKRLTAAQASVQEMESKMARFCQASTGAASLSGVVALHLGELADADSQHHHNCSALQTRANGDCDMPHAAVPNRTYAQLLLEAELQELQSVDCAIKGFPRTVDCH